jgi:hypothetical protein
MINPTSVGKLWLKQAAYWGLLPAVLWPLFALGYPLLYQDTVAYIYGGFVDRLNGMWFEIRSPLYAYFLLLTTSGISLYLIAIIQALLALYVVKKVFEGLLLGIKKRIFIIAIAGTISTLPWYVCLITPDIFSGFIPLLLFGLLEVQGTSLATAALLGISIAMHNTNVVLYPFLLVTAIPLYRKTTLPLKKWVQLVVVGLAAALLLMSFTWARTGRFALNEFGVGTFLVNRWINDRVMQPFLEQLCALPNPLIACRHLEEFENTQVDGFWTNSFYINEHGGFKAAQDELRWLTVTFVRHKTFVALKNAFENACRQFITFGVPLWAFSATDSLWQYEQIFSIYRFDESFFAASLIHDDNVRNKIYSLMNIELVIQYCLVCLAIALSCLLPKLRCTGEQRLFYICFMFYLYNIVLCAAISGPFERFSGRVGWALFVASLTVAIRSLSIWRNGPGVDAKGQRITTKPYNN